MLTQIQKDLLQLAAQRGVEDVKNIFVVAALMLDIDTVQYIIAKHSNLFTQEDLAKAQEVENAINIVIAQDEAEAATIQ